MSPRRDAGSSEAKNTAVNGAAKNAAANRGSRRARIHPLSGAALALVLTAPVLIMGLRPWPAATVQTRGTHLRAQQANVDSVRAARSGAYAGHAAGPAKRATSTTTHGGRSTGPAAPPGAPRAPAHFHPAAHDSGRPAAPRRPPPDPQGL